MWEQAKNFEGTRLRKHDNIEWSFHHDDEMPLQKQERGHKWLRDYWTVLFFKIGITNID